MNGYDDAIEIKNNLVSFFFPPSTWKGKKCKYNLLQLFRDYHVYYCSSLGKDITYNIARNYTDCHGIEVLHGGHVACQEQYNIIPMGQNVHSNAKHFYCSWHATWPPCKTSIDALKTIKEG